MGRHVALGRVVGGGAAAEHHRADRAVQFGDRDHHRGLDRQQTARIGIPLLERLEFDRRGGNVGHIQRGEQRLGGAAVVVGGSTDEREPGQRHDGVDRGHAVLHEIRLDCGAGVEPAGEGGNDAQAARFECCDCTVIMGCVAGDEVGAEEQETDRALRPFFRYGDWRGVSLIDQVQQPARAPDDGSGLQQERELFGQPTRQRRVIQADIRIIHRRGGAHLGLAAVAADQHPHQVGQILVRAGQPVLQAEKIRPDILRRARDEAHQLREPAQHLHLRLTVGADAVGLALAGLGPTQLLQHRERAGRLFHHVELAEPGQPGDLVGRHAAQHGVAVVAPGGQRALDRADVVFHEQHRRDDDVAAADVLDALGERRLVAAPLVCGVDHQREARKLCLQPRLRAGSCAGQVAVHRHDDDPDGLGEGDDVIAHSVLLRHRACPP